MPEYHVSGSFSMPVEADSEEAAVDRAMDQGGWEWEATPWEEHVKVPSKWATERGWFEIRTILLDLHIQHPQPERRAAKRFMPARALIHWRRSDVEPAWILADAVVSGPRLKADGTDSKAPEYEQTYFGGHRDDLPDWLAEIVESTRP